MDVPAYLDRIGYRGPRRVEASTLARLQRAHLLSVPFDTLDCHLGLPVTTAPADAYRKVVAHRRGGFCFELNGLFGWLLDQLGFPVVPVGARVLLGDRQLTPPYAHLALLVELERRWLVDVGFGHPFALAPLDIDVRGEQRRGGRRFRVRADGDALVAEQRGVAEPRGYQFTVQPAPPDQLAKQCSYYATDPASPFVQAAPVTQLLPDGWVTVTRQRVTGARGGDRFDDWVRDEADWRRQLWRHAGLAVQGRQVRGLGMDAW